MADGAGGPAANQPKYVDSQIPTLTWWNSGKMMNEADGQVANRPSISQPDSDPYMGRGSELRFVGADGYVLVLVAQADIHVYIYIYI